MDRDEARRFIDDLTTMAAGATTIGLLAVADRCGLLAGLAETGGGTAQEIAVATGLEPRYIEEIMSGLAAAGIVAYEPRTATFALSAEHAACIADEDSPYFMGGWFDMVPAVLARVDEVAAAARHGGGVPFDSYGETMVRGIARANGPSLRLLLTRKWLPAMPDVVGRLESGARVADVGCGSGAAASAMARAYPRSDVWGFDPHPASIERARRAGSDVGNVRFEVCAAGDIPVEPPFDMIAAFDAVHDMAHPVPALRRLAEALAPGGTFLMMEPNAGPRLEDNLHPRGALLYGTSALHCMPQARAGGGVGLGAAWGPQRAEDLCREAGFTRFERLDIDNDFSSFYRVER